MGNFLKLCAVVILLLGLGPLELNSWFARASEIGAGQALTVTFEDRKICRGTYSQVPGKSNLFVGRLRQGADPAECKKGPWTLGLFEMDWSARKLSLIQYVAKMPLQLENGVKVTNAYDPHLASHKGEIWAAFECTSPALSGASACIAPMSPNLDRIDESRLTIPVVNGSIREDDTEMSSASVPKLLSFNGRMYMYWTAVRRKRMERSQWVNLSVRGIELEQEVLARRRFWGKNSSGKPTISDDPSLTAEVLERQKDRFTENLTADILDVQADGAHILVLASVGGQGCLRPTDDAPNCYRLRMFRTTKPLGPNSLGQEALVAPSLPEGPQGYARLLLDPEGGQRILSLSYSSRKLAALRHNQDSSAPLAGLRLYVFPKRDMLFSRR